MAARWFRRPDGVLVASSTRTLAAKFAARGYEPVDTETAVAEVKSGKQEELNSDRAAEDARQMAQQRVTEDARKRQERIGRARQTVTDAQLETKAPQPPKDDPGAAKVVKDEAAPQDKRK